MAEAYDEVTSRSNSLMNTCENLLEQQHSLQNLVMTIKHSLEPLNNVEDFAHILGIPTDAYGSRTQIKQTSSSVHHATPASDPRSADFQKTMNHITTAMKFIKDHPDLKDAELYKKWLKMLQHRAHAITTRNMMELLHSTEHSCQSVMHQQSLGDINSLVSSPLESLPLYQKFRALGFRMRQLTALLPNRYDDITIDDEGQFDTNNDSSSFQDPIVQVRQSYITLRTQLLSSFLAMVNKAVTPSSSEQRQATPNPNPNPPGTLSTHMRQLFSYLLRIAHLEQQLFFSLFKPSDLDPTTTTAENASSDSVAIMEYSVEVEGILDSLCSQGVSFLRPMIIREMSVDELCKVISALAEGTVNYVFQSISL